MCLDISPSYIKENVDIVLHGDASLVLKYLIRFIMLKTQIKQLKRLKTNIKAVE